MNGSVIDIHCITLPEGQEDECETCVMKEVKTYICFGGGAKPMIQHMKHIMFTKTS